MATGTPTFPTTLDTDSTLGPTSGISTTGSTLLSATGTGQGDQVGITRNLINSVIALETKVGVTSSTDINSLDYKTAHSTGSGVSAVSDLTGFDIARFRNDFPTDAGQSDYFHLQGNQFLSSGYSTSAGDSEPWDAQGIVWYSLKDSTNLSIDAMLNGFQVNPRNDVDFAIRWTHNNRDPMSNGTVAQPIGLKYQVGFVGPQIDIDSGGAVGHSGFGLFYSDIVGANWMLFHNTTGGWTGSSSAAALISAGNLVSTGIPFTFTTPYIFRFTMARGWATCAVQISSGQGTGFTYTGNITLSGLAAFVNNQAYYFSVAQNGGAPYSATAATNINIIDWVAYDVNTRRSLTYSTT